LPKVKVDLNDFFSRERDNLYINGDLPVDSASWDQAVEFCERLSRATGKKYQLPSESEWEYACRAGTSSRFGFGDTITPKLESYGKDPFENHNEVLLPDGVSRAPYQGLTPVGSSGVPNPFGLYDMLGNVSEFCLDSWHANYQGAPSDGSAWVSTNPSGEPIERVVRGGSWFSPSVDCRCAARWSIPPRSFSDASGFRVVMQTN
jgi:formylglycine-generating enzyme required for sulfatase activity